MVLRNMVVSRRSYTKMAGGLYLKRGLRNVKKILMRQERKFQDFTIMRESSPPYKTFPRRETRKAWAWCFPNTDNKLIDHVEPLPEKCYMRKLEQSTEITH